MIEISHYKPSENGSRLATFTIKIPKWGNAIIREVSLFSKNNHRWISMPCRAYEKEGKKKYFSFVGFDDPKMMDVFQKKILEALDQFLLTYSPTQALEEENPF